MSFDFNIGIKLFRGGVDPRCDTIVVNPITYLCEKYNIPMGENVLFPKIFLSYRFVHGPKQGTLPQGVFIDDYPPEYHPACGQFLNFLKTYDFIVTPNPKILEYLFPIIGHKPSLIYNGICNRDYYADKGNLTFDKNLQEKRMAFIFQGGYTFPIDDFYKADWKLMYFHPRALHTNPNIIHHLPMDIGNFYRTVSSYAPDVIVQSWVDQPYFSYKSNLKFRESITFKSCLVAKDLNNINGITHGVNGYKWGNISEFHNILDATPIDQFRAIGNNHINRDKEVLEDLYTRIVELTSKL